MHRSLRGACHQSEHVWSRNCKQLVQANTAREPSQCFSNCQKIQLQCQVWDTCLLKTALSSTRDGNATESFDQPVELRPQVSFQALHHAVSMNKRRGGDSSMGYPVFTFNSGKQRLARRERKTPDLLCPREDQMRE